MTLGKRLATLRKEMGMSRPAMAIDFGTAYPTLYSWEADVREPNMGSLTMLADYFNVSLDWLLGRTDNREIIGQRATDGKTFGERLKMKKTQLNLKRYELAEELDTYEQKITFWEKGTFMPRASMLPSLADVLGVSLDWLAGRSDKE